MIIARNLQGKDLVGVIVVPNGTDMNEITPIQYKKSFDNKDVKITHMEMH